MTAFYPTGGSESDISLSDFYDEEEINAANSAGDADALDATSNVDGVDDLDEGSSLDDISSDGSALFDSEDLIEEGLIEPDYFYRPSNSGLRDYHEEDRILDEEELLDFDAI
jgi:hypothetical protein